MANEVERKFFEVNPRTIKVGGMEYNGSFYLRPIGEGRGGGLGTSTYVCIGYAGRNLEEAESRLEWLKSIEIQRVCDNLTLGVGAEISEEGQLVFNRRRIGLWEKVKDDFFNPINGGATVYGLHLGYDAIGPHFSKINNVTRK